jgi:predicted ABC-type ATPase
MTKWMWIIAGPNGAGKSTFVNHLLESYADLIKLNADERTLALRVENPDAPQRDLNLQAAQEIDAEVADCIAKGQSFLVETVLSSPKYRDDVEAAQAAGYTFGLVYVSLHPPELSPERVAIRVVKGGHAVDRQTAIERHARSHVELRWFAAKADVLAVYDNSLNDGTPRLVATRGQGERLKVHARGINPSVDKALRIERPGRKRRRDAEPT